MATNKTKFKKKVIIGVSSGIAAYKILDLIKILREENYEVYVIMTANATRMINPSEFEKVSGHKVYTSLFDKDFTYKEILEKKEVEHIKIADSASLIVIAPATANIIGKIAHGLADDFLTTILLAREAPVLLCPSMNTKMWKNPLVAENIKKLKKLGHYILEPDKGRLACGYYGIGRLPTPKKILNEILDLLNKKERLKGKKIMVTGGGTVEPIDAIRVITNRASGKMGLALAEESHLQGAEVLLLRSESSVSPRYEIKEEIFKTSKSLAALIKKHVKDYDILFHTAAVSDFLPGKTFANKIDSQKPITLKLNPAPKILHQIKSWNPKIKLVGFKAVYKLTDKDLVRAGFSKLKESNSDYIIVNDVGRKGIGFGADDNEVYIISSGGLLAKIEKSPKKEVARKILEYII